MLRNYIIKLFAILLIFITGCKKFDLDTPEIIIPAVESYYKGEELINNKNFNKAAKEFSLIYFQHPGAKITPYAEFMEAYCLYKSKQYLSAIEVLNAFIEMHPSHPYIADAYYLVILSYLNEASDIYHNQEYILNAKIVAEAFLRSFPDNKYVKNVQHQLEIIKNYIIAHEIVIGNYYIEKNNPIASLLRYQNAKRQYPNSSYHPEALYRLVVTCQMLGLDKDTNFYKNELQAKHPNSYWTKILKNSTN